MMPCFTAQHMCMCMPLPCTLQRLLPCRGARQRCRDICCAGFAGHPPHHDGCSPLHASSAFTAGSDSGRLHTDPPPHSCWNSHPCCTSCACLHITGGPPGDMGGRSKWSKLTTAHCTGLRTGIAALTTQQTGVYTSPAAQALVQRRALVQCAVLPSHLVPPGNPQLQHTGVHHPVHDGVT